MTRLSALQSCRSRAAVARLLREHGVSRKADPIAALLALDPGVERVTVWGGGMATVVTRGTGPARVEIGDGAEDWVREFDAKRERRMG